MNDATTPVGKFLRKIRKERKESQLAVGARIARPANWASRIESGRDNSIKLYEVVKAYELREEEIKEIKELDPSLALTEQLLNGGEGFKVETDLAAKFLNFSKEARDRILKIVEIYEKLRSEV